MDAIKAAASRRSFMTASLAGGAALALAPVASHSQQRTSRMQPTIAVDNDFATQINIATVEPENQPKLVQFLREATDTMFSKMPGWISTSILKGKDGRRVFIYSQWRSSANIEAFRKDPNERSVSGRHHRPRQVRGRRLRRDLRRARLTA